MTSLGKQSYAGAPVILGHKETSAYVGPFWGRWFLHFHVDNPSGQGDEQHVEGDSQRHSTEQRRVRCEIVEENGLPSSHWKIARVVDKTGGHINSIPTYCMIMCKEHTQGSQDVRDDIRMLSSSESMCVDLGRYKQVLNPCANCNQQDSMFWKLLQDFSTGPDPSDCHVRPRHTLFFSNSLSPSRETASFRERRGRRLQPDGRSKRSNAEKTPCNNLFRPRRRRND